MSCQDKWHILEINNLTVSFRQYDKGTSQTDLPVISNLNVSVHEGEIVAVVGASGSGKSLLAHAILGILPGNASSSGEIYFEQEVLTPKRKEQVRGREIALVPQSVNYLDPLMKVGRQVRDGKDDAKTLQRQQELFRKYNLPDNAGDLYPFECSGGMSRRILLCTALMGNPKLIIADEPTPGMELSLAKKAMEDFRAFADEGNGVLLITHDIELALEVADRIAVFYAGTTVEETPVEDFQAEERLRHPYTKALWRAMPRNGFSSIPGNQPYVKDLPKGCVFGPRCPMYSEECQGEIPEKIVRCGTVRCVKCEGEKVHYHTHIHDPNEERIQEHIHNHSLEHIHSHTHDHGHSHVHRDSMDGHTHDAAHTAGDHRHGKETQS